MLDLKPIVELSRSIRAHGLFGRGICRAVGGPDYPVGGGGEVVIQGFLKKNVLLLFLPKNGGKDTLPVPTALLCILSWTVGAV